MSLVIKSGRVIDPAQGLDEVLDVLIQEGRIAKLGKGLNGEEVVDARGKIVCPGFIDMHTHLREPGREDEETIASGSVAAAAGGFTAICCMANTNPVNDNQAVTDFILHQAKTLALISVYPIGAITKGLKGEEMAEFGDLKAAGCVAFSDDGRPVMNSNLMRRALEYTGMLNLPLIEHCEDLSLSGSGVMNEGFTSTRLGFRGIPAAAEEVMVARNIILAEMTGARLHIAHVSTAGSTRLIREAKSRGVRVSGEVCPHHFALSEEALASFDTNLKMNPPLRSAEDVAALKQGLADGTLEAIASDHAPHAVSEKEVEFDYAVTGIVGLETAVSLSLHELYHKGVLPLPDLVARFTAGPAGILGLKKGCLAEGSDADLTLLDLEKEVLVDPSKSRSKSRNTPFSGWKLKGAPWMTLCGGRIVFDGR
ncbi:MAG: dihydroorotase [bacterium]